VFDNLGTQLFDLARDPEQLTPIRDHTIEERLRTGIIDVLSAHDAPHELFARYGLARAGAV
jgi:hypothetical protein